MPVDRIVVGNQVQVSFSPDGETWWQLPAYVSSVQMSVEQEPSFLDSVLLDSPRYFSSPPVVTATIELAGSGELLLFLDSGFGDGIQDMPHKFIICPYCGFHNALGAAYCGDDSTHGCGGPITGGSNG